MALQRGLLDLALVYFIRATRVDRTNATLWNDLGDALSQAARPDDALAAHLRALTIAPNDSERFTRLGRALHREGWHLEARAAYADAVRLAPCDASLQGELGDVLLDQGRLNEALACYERSRELGADRVESAFRFGRALSSLGRWQDALQEFRFGLAEAADRSDLHAGCAQAMVRLGLLEEAERAYRAALTISPNDVSACRELVVLLELLGRREDAIAAWIGLGAALEAHGRMPDALAVYRHVHAPKANGLGALLGLARVHLSMGDADAAVRWFDAALAIDPDHAQIHVDRGRALQQTGAIDDGWSGLAWHHRPYGTGWRHGDLPLWDGSPLHGRRLWLWTDAATRPVDALLFLRYVSFAIACEGRVVVECDPALVPLVANLPGVEEVIAFDGPTPRCDVHAPLLYLPALVAPARAFVATMPYLRVTEAQAQTWRARLRRDDGPVIGIAWGDSTSERPIPAGLRLDAFRRLFADRRDHLVSLQLGPRADEVLEPPAGLSLVRCLSDTATIVDVASAVVNVDLVMTADPRMAHLAAALGRPVWMLLPRGAPWPWPARGDRTPWYPTMHLFRQTRAGDWTSALMAMQRVLDGELAAVSES